MGSLERPSQGSRKEDSLLIISLRARVRMLKRHIYGVFKKRLVKLFVRATPLRASTFLVFFVFLFCGNTACHGLLIFTVSPTGFPGNRCAKVNESCARCKDDSRDIIHRSSRETLSVLVPRRLRARQRSRNTRTPPISKFPEPRANVRVLCI